jgi:hypothetical protein
MSWFSGDCASFGNVACYQTGAPNGIIVRSAAMLRRSFF